MPYAKILLLSLLTEDKMKKYLLAALVLFGFGTAAHAQTAEAKLASTSTSTYVSGTVKFEDTADGLKVTALIDKAPAGTHGFHIHEFGSCDDTGNKAGGHYNPEGHEHGQVGKTKMSHPGDMGNIEIGADGKGKLETVLPGVTLSSGKMPVAGRAIILHAKVDDMSQPTGNAGGRIGCAPIVITGK
jgi:Cu-Zn family superoxide dismutase